MSRRGDTWCPECDEWFDVSPDWIVDGLKPGKEVEDRCPHCDTPILLHFEVAVDWTAHRTPTNPQEDGDE